MIVSSNLIVDTMAFCFLILVFGVVILVESPDFKNKVLFITLTTLAVVVLLIILIGLVNLVSWFLG